ncbi:MAG: protein kinase, partial [Myxococcales bacterium]|nr:protein kinase [Myxococcales bacterium]
MLFLAFQPPSWVPPGLWDKRLLYLAATALVLYVAYLIARRILQSAKTREIDDAFRRTESSSSASGGHTSAFSRERARLSSDIHEAVQNQNFERAAGLYVKSGNHAAAARMYLRIDAPARAALLFEQAGVLSEAAQAHEQAGDLKRAAELYRQLGDDRRADRLTSNPLARGPIPPRTTPSVGRPPLELPPRPSDRRSAEFQYHGEEPTRPSDRRTAELQYHGGEMQELARLGKFREAAAVAQQSGDVRQAASLYERAEAWEEAAECHRSRRDRKAAARCLFQLGKNVEAIRELKSLDNTLEAAAFCADVRQFYSAGRFYEESARVDLAQACYLQVTSLDSDFRFAIGRAVTIATELGKPEPVIERLRPTVELTMPSLADRPRFVAYARMLILARRHAEAARVYETLREHQLIVEDEIPDELLELIGDGPLPTPPSSDSGLPRLSGAEALAVPRNSSPFGGTSEADRPRQATPTPRRPQARSTAEALATITEELEHEDHGEARSDELFAELGLHPDSRYQLTLAIGEGGAGEVYLARDVNLSRRVVIKFLKHELTSNPTIAKYFVQEARISAQLTHPNIVTIHDVGVLQGRPFIVMEYLQGDTLDRIYEMRSRPITDELNRTIVSQLCDALTYAHDKQIVHRDIKGENVMITIEGVVKLMDFGVAKVLNHNSNKRSVF